MNLKVIEYLKDEFRCDDGSCVCFHCCDYGDENDVEIGIHALSRNARNMTFDFISPLSERVIMFLNADAYDFVKAIQEKEKENVTT